MKRMGMVRVWIGGFCALGLAAGVPSAFAQTKPAPAPSVAPPPGPAPAAAPAAEAAAADDDAPPASGAAVDLPDLSSDVIAERVQSFYDGAKTFQAQFSQRYTIFAYNKKKESQGHVAFVKPGKMSWRYSSNGNRVVSDGKLLRVYEADNKQLYEQDMTKSAYPAALSFLLGQGKLTASFTLKKLNEQTLKFKGGYVLLAIPKEATPAYQKMLLYVDGKTFQVRRVLLIDAQKNKNVFDFSDPRVNEKVPASEFTFTPPPGTQIVKP
ncbi:MAG TPA: outer membrane lipoprotein carrier protein LolA [Polyangiaceae bacterium]|nr:outer membrane lipoprotein carrier protein LolA [Polyangiaceae bacterium]